MRGVPRLAKRPAPRQAYPELRKNQLGSLSLAVFLEECSHGEFVAAVTNDLRVSTAYSKKKVHFFQVGCGFSPLCLGPRVTEWSWSNRVAGLGAEQKGS